jgi:type IV secretion system protein VirD4
VTANRFLLLIAPMALMLGAIGALAGVEHGFSGFGRTEAQHLLFARAGLALPYIAAAVIGVIFLFAAAGSANIRTAAWSVVAGCAGAITIAVARATIRVAEPVMSATPGRSPLAPIDPAVLVGACAVLIVGVFALRVGAKGNAAFAAPTPKRVRGRRALHGDADWMTMTEAARLFPDVGGIVVGERYRVDKDSMAATPFRATDRQSWGEGGRSPLLGFDTSFGSSHGVVFAGSGGFKTTSVTIPTALKWSGALVALDPSSEVAPMVIAHRQAAGRTVHVLDPHAGRRTAHGGSREAIGEASGDPANLPPPGFNALDWIGRFGGTKEEDIASVASWIVSDSGGARGVRDDFFRASALQLLTALIADVCLSGHTEEKNRTLRQVRANLSEPEPKLRARLQAIYDNSDSAFVKENVAVFVNMTPETFSGVYANAVKETHWLSYPNYAALVSGSTFVTDDLANGDTDVFINLDLKTLETHAGLARVIIGAFMNAIYNRHGDIKGRALFLLDEVARLGFMRILETARDAGRKYGITLLLLFQSIGQMRETYGGRDAASKWFESASWITFAGVNDPETADYISKRCGMTTVEIDQVSRSSQASGSSRTRSKQLASRPLIQPHEVLRMRADEQIVFTAGNAPLRCGRAIWFRRDDMRTCVGANRFQPETRR